jgi:hypothetical protein
MVTNRSCAMRTRHFLIRFLTPIVWRLSEKRKLAALQEFSDIELDSAWQSLYGMERVEDPRAKAELFLHSLEEFYHAEMFSKLLNSYSNAPLNRVAFSREAILSTGKRGTARNDEMLNFLMQVYVGESEINQDFLVYANSNIDHPIRELFNRIKKDEEGHEELSWNLLLSYANNNAGRLRRLHLKKRFQHAYKRYANFMQIVGNLFLGIKLTVIYFLLGGLFASFLRKRLALNRDEQLLILLQQLEPVKGIRT